MRLEFPSSSGQPTSSPDPTALTQAVQEGVRRPREAGCFKDATQHSMRGHCDRTRAMKHLSWQSFLVIASAW